MISKETIKYVGLSDDKADELWDKWTNWPSTGPRREVDADDGGLQVTFSDFVLGHAVYSHPDITSEDDGSWTTYLSLCGFADTVQEAIMDPVFRYLRLSESAAHWAKDTIRMRFAGLWEIQETSRQRQMANHRQRLGPAGEQAVVNGSPAPPPGPASSSSSSEVPQTRQEAQEQQEQASLGDVVAQNASGYTCLYKGLDQARASGLFDSSGALGRLGTMLSSPPSDFSATKAMLSFSADIKVAEYSAAYAKRRANCEAAVILCLRIPNTAIESLSPPDIERLFWPQDEWKQLVWYSRIQRHPVPSHLRKYRNTILTIGTISRKPDAVYNGMSSWEDVTEQCVFKVAGGGPAVQFVFTSEDAGLDFLMENGAKDMKIVPLADSNLEDWLAYD